MPQTVRRGRGTGVPVYSLVLEPAAPTVMVRRIDQESIAHAPVQHTHDFPVLVYFARDGGAVRTGGRTRSIRAGGLLVIAPGDLVDVGAHPEIHRAGGTCVLFTPDALGPDRPDSALAWRTHPLLFPFVRGEASGALLLRVPEARRAHWSAGLAAIEAELEQRRDGYRHAALAHLVLLLVEVARMADDVLGDLRLNNEPLLAEVFEVIERRFGERLSLRDVARAVNLTPGHLTTTVRRRTGRTVQDWITARRMTEARRLLVTAELSIGAVARRIGYPDPGYFARTFRREHGLTPRQWRDRGQ